MLAFAAASAARSSTALLISQVWGVLSSWLARRCSRSCGCGFSGGDQTITLAATALAACRSSLLTTYFLIDCIACCDELTGHQFGPLNAWEGSDELELVSLLVWVVCGGDEECELIVTSAPQSRSWGGACYKSSHHFPSLQGPVIMLKAFDGLGGGAGGVVPWLLMANPCSRGIVSATSVRHSSQSTKMPGLSD